MLCKHVAWILSAHRFVYQELFAFDLVLDPEVGHGTMSFLAEAALPTDPNRRRRVAVYVELPVAPKVFSTEMSPSPIEDPLAIPVSSASPELKATVGCVTDQWRIR